MHLLFQRRAKRAFQQYIHSECGCSYPIPSEMAGPRGLKLGGLVEGMGENILMIHDSWILGHRARLLHSCCVSRLWG